MGREQETYQSVYQTLVRNGDDALRTHTHRDVVVQSLSELFFDRKHVLLAEIRADQTNTAVYIITHTSFT